MQDEYNNVACTLDLEATRLAGQVTLKEYFSMPAFVSYCLS
jgi:hypothetical protein